MLRDLLRLQLGDRDARLAACKALAESRSALAAHFLARAARHDGHVWVRGEATLALGALGGAKARKAVLEALESADWEVRVAAVSGLAGGGHRGAAEAVARRLSDESALVRRLVPWALAKLAGPEAVPLLAPALRDGDAEVRAAALTCLAELSGAAAIGSLVSGLTDETQEVRLAAVRALGTVGGTEIMAPLVAAAGDVDRAVRGAALEVLTRSDPAWATSAGAREVAAGAEKDLGHQDWRRRVRAANVLAVVPTADPTPLVVALARGDADLREALTRGLALRGWTPSNTEEAVRTHLVDKDWNRLRALGEPAFEACLELAMNADRARRKEAIDGLLQFGDAAHTGRVVALLSEEIDGELRRYVFLGLLEAEDVAVDRGELCRRYLGDAELAHLAARHLVKSGDAGDLDAIIAYLLDGGAAWNREVVTALGNTWRREDADPGAKNKIRRCMKTLASEGNEEAAAICWLAERGE